MLAKTFLKAIEELTLNPKKLAGLLSDKRITQQEKCILQSMVLLRDNHFDQIEKLLGHLNIQDSFVEAQRLSILGQAYNNQSNFKKSSEYLEKAFLKMKECPIRYNTVIILHSLFLSYFNAKRKMDMERVLDLMEEFGAENANEEICIKRARLNYALFTSNFTKASQMIQMLEKHQSEMSNTHKLSFLFDKFDFYIKREDFSEAKKALLDMKNFRKFYLSASYKSLNAFLDHYCENKPLYVYENDYIEFPHIHLEVMTLKHLEEKEEAKALGFWNKLHAMNPEIYGEKFVYLGDKCLFSMCLTRALAFETQTPSFAGAELTKEELIFKILTQSKSLVQKEKMFELVYGTKPQDKTDMARLSNLISKLKRKKDIKIINRKNCYFLAS